VRFWDPITGDLIGEPLRSHAGRIWELQFSPDGKTLFTTSGDETLGVWDVESRELRARIPDHIGGSKALCVSKSGTWLLTGGLWDNKIHIRRLRPDAEP
jgi:WD40 repeat protein